MSSPKIIFSSMLLLLLFSCGNENRSISLKDDESVQEDKTLITDLIKVRMLIIDTTNPANIQKMYGDGKSSLMFHNLDNEITKLNAKEFNVLFSTFYQMIKVPTCIVTNWEGKIIPSKEAINVYRKCDSMEIMDEKGKMTKTFACDSTSGFLFIKMLDFYEKWELNNKTGMIEKTVLAMSGERWNEGSANWQVFFTIFRDEKAYKEVKQKMQL